MRKVFFAYPFVLRLQYVALYFIVIISVVATNSAACCVWSLTVVPIICIVVADVAFGWSSVFLSYSTSFYFLRLVAWLKKEAFALIAGCAWRMAVLYVASSRHAALLTVCIVQQYSHSAVV